MNHNLLAIADAATVKRLARIIRDGTNQQCGRAFDDLMDTHGLSLGGDLWNDAMALADARSEIENAEGGTS
jgi:hypothetical protein